MPFLVKYKVTLKDHTGYCSGRDADDDRSDHDETEDLYELDDNDISEACFDADGFVNPEKLLLFKKVEKGCTSSGSGCCAHYGDYYEPLYVKDVTKYVYGSLKELINTVEEERILKKLAD